MANEEHLRILRGGVEQWNAWIQTIEITPDLSQADLTNATLIGANLGDANLRKAVLKDADLSGANLVKAKLRGAHLLNANLSRADMSLAVISEVDLHRANLSQANLTKANLTRANLTGTRLFRAKLTMADLSGADLSVADLSEADLEGATLELAELPGANLRSANLKTANLTRANLSATNLTRANLINTDITEALLLDTTFARVDLRSIRGLEAVTHLGPSTIDIATMVESNGQIPGFFLRGCGVPEPFIVNLRSLIGAMAPIQFYSSFISYSSKDQHFAHRLHADMQARGIRCWFAPEDLKIGDVFSHRIEESIRVHDKMILILSKHSVASSWVRREVEAAREREDREHRDVLFPITLDEAAMQSSEAWAADIRRSRQIGDFKRWKNHDVYQKAFDRLMRDLQKRETSATPS